MPPDGLSKALSSAVLPTTKQQAYVYSNDKHTRPDSGRASGSPSRFCPPVNTQATPGKDRKSAPQGRYDGVYRLDGFTLRRSDGVALVTCYRSGNVGQRSSNRYLALASDPSRPFVGNLYRSPGLDGAEFDDRVHRYRVERVDAERYRIRTLRRKGQRAPRRNGQ